EGGTECWVPEVSDRTRLVVVVRRGVRDGASSTRVTVSGLAGDLHGEVGYRDRGVGCVVVFFFSSRRRHTRLVSDWSSDVCSSDLSRLRPAEDDRRSGGRSYLPSSSLTDLRSSSAGLRRLLYGLSRKVHARNSRWREIGRASCRERGEVSGVEG